MESRLLNIGDLFSQSSDATTGLLGGGIFSQPETRGQRRSRLLTDAISNAGQDPYARLGAAFGGLVGMGARAGAEGLGILDQPEEVKKAEAVRQVQREAAEAGVDLSSDPRGFRDFVVNRFQELGQDQLAIDSLIRIGAVEKEIAPEPVETNIRAVGGTPRANALVERYPEIGQLAEGQEVFITLLDGEFRGVETKSTPEDRTPSRIREYTLALERGLINENTTLEEYNRLRAGGDKRRAAAPTETSLSPFEAVIDTNEEIKNRIEGFVEDTPQATLAGIGIPFTGGRDEDAVSAVSLQVQQRALEIRNQSPELSVEQSLNEAINELNTLRSGAPAPDTTGAPTAPAGTATPQNDPFAGRVNP